VPTSLQYPLERERDLERRWNRLLQRTAPKKDLRQKRRASASPRRSPSSAFRPARTATATAERRAACGLLALLPRNPAPTPAKAINRLDDPWAAPMPSWLEQEQPKLQFSRKVSGTKMFWETKEFGPAFCKATFLSSSPLTPATESGLCGS
jgi:hypothetical protein